VAKNRRNIWLYYLISACQSAWFTEAVWYFYFRKFTDYSNMALWFSILNILWVGFEIPTGVIADKFGRKLSSFLGTLLVTVGIGVVAFTHGFWVWIVGLILENLGRAFVSGALEALVYDDLKSVNLDKIYGQVEADKSWIVTIVYVVAVISGGFIGKISLSLPYIVQMVVSGVSTVACLFLDEGKIQSDGEQSGLAFSIEGIKQFKKPGLRPYLITSWMVMAMYFLFDWGLAKPTMATKFGFFERGQGIVYGLAAVVGIIVLRNFEKIRKFIGDRNGLRWLNILMMICMMTAIFPLGIVGFLPIMIIENVGTIYEPWVLTIVNQHLESKYRATAISALNMFGQIPYILFNPIVGNLVEKGCVNLIFVMLAGIIGIGLGVDYVLSKKGRRWRLPVIA